MGATIKATGLEREFAGSKGSTFKAVRGVDLDIPSGEVYGFLGPNGAGKTTVVRMLVTLLRPTGGSAHVAGFDVRKEAPQVRRAIGVALQEAALDPLMTGVELLHLQATLHGLNKRDAYARTEELLERVDLVAAKDNRVGTYSGGMRRRLDLAMALVHKPRVLFLDEPTTGLDPVSRMTLWNEVRALNRDGTTVFLTTQYLEEADQLADRVGIIAKGEIVAEGSPAELKAEIGRGRLDVCVSKNGSLDRAREVLGKFGELVEPIDGVSVSVTLHQQHNQLAPAAVALDQAGVQIESIDVVEPSLDDVFLAKTGLHLEAADEAKHGEAAAATAAA